MLDAANGNDAKLEAKKRRALETVSVSRNVGEKHPQTAISSADGAKVLKNLDALADNYENSSSTNEKTFIGEVAKSLGINAPDKSSKYATFETKNGKAVTVRFSNHNAKVSNFDANGEADGISIVVSAKKSNGITNDGDAHVTEYYYDAIKLRKAEGKPLAEVAKSIKQLLYSGEFKDPTGLAEVQEVNAEDIARFQKAYHGSHADFDHFDHSHMGEGEGAQAFGWGTYVTEVKGIGKSYAKKLAKHTHIVLGIADFLGNSRSAINALMSPGTHKKTLLRLIDRAINTQEAILRGTTWDVMIKNAETALDKLKTARALIASEPQSFLYTVEIPDDNGSNYLDYDGKISDIPSQKIDAICEQLEKLGWERKDLPSAVRLTDGYNNIVFYPNAAGKDLYREIGAALKSDKQASLLLSRVGFVGIKYPADYRRGGRADHAKNYVIFNENDARETDHVRFFRTPDSKDVHLAVLKVLPDVLRESVDAEQHPDYNKGADGVRSAENGINPDVTIHRLYGAVTMGGKLYRVKVTLKEDSARSDDPKKAYSYCETKIELLAGTLGKPEDDAPNTSNSITTANLLQGVEKSYGDGKFFEDDGMPRTGDPAADADEGKWFRLLDDDDPQAQELEALPESKPRETLAQAMVHRVKELAAKLGAKVRIETSADELAESPTRRQRKMKGMYDTKTGEVTIVIGNHENLADVENTVLHEVVGHGGFRVLFDTKEKLDNAMNELYRVSGEKIRKWIDEKARKLYDAEVDRIMARKRKEREARGEDPSDFHLKDMADAHLEASKKKDEFRRIATEEYGAELAGRIGEKGFEKLSAEEQTFWGRLKSMLQKALQRLAEGLNITGKHEWTDKDWAYVLHEAYKREKNGGRPSIFDEADTIATRLRTGFGEGKEERKGEESSSVEEVNQKFNDELDAYANKSLPQGHRFDLGMPSPELESAGFPRLPISMRSALLSAKSALARHPFSPKDLKDLVKAIQRPIAVFNYTKDNMRNVIVDLERGGKHFLVGVTLGYKGNGIEINSVSGLFPKDSHEWIKWIQDGKAIRIDQKEKVLNLIDSLRTTNTAESARIGLDLDTAANIVQGFENPKLPEENISDEGKMFRGSEGGNPDEGMMFRDGDDDDIGEVDLGDAVDKMRNAAAESNANNLQAKRDAMKAIGGNLSKLRQAMSRQRVYDKGTVKSVTDLARAMLQNGMLDKLSSYEAKRILSAAANVTGAENKKGAAEVIRQRLAERQGFEPWKPKGFNGFRDRPDRPLRHLSSRFATACFAVASAKLHNFANCAK